MLHDRVQHSAGVWLIKQQRLTRPVHQHPDLLRSPHYLQRQLDPCVAVGVVSVIVGQHPGLAVVAQSGLVPGAFALQGGVADADLKGPTLPDVHHPAVDSRGHGQ